MILYTINGKYPDQSFAFTLSASDLNLAPAVHSHGISDILLLNDTLSGKADTDHSHVCVTTLYKDTPGEAATTVPLSISATGTSQPAITLSGQTVFINYVSLETGNALGIVEQNPLADYVIVQVYGGTLATTNETEAGFLVMEGNRYA